MRWEHFCSLLWTIIPLHRIEAIITAAKRASRTSLEWILIKEEKIESMIEEHPISHLKCLQWITYEEFVKWIHLLGICVGILGDSKKANRVIPNKVFQILSRYLFGASGSHILLLTGAFAIAWVAGFLDPGAPAGIGG